MGQFLSSIQQQIDELNKSIPNFCLHPLQKIYQFHGIYKSICDSFSIKRSEYEQIFGTEQGFSIWQREHSQKLDALELFTGLAAVSAATFKEKLRFLFELFDFNQVRSISTMDFQYLLVCIANSTFKMLGKNAKVANGEVSELVKKHFGLESRRIIITELLRKCVRCVEIRRYFELLGRDIGGEMGEIGGKGNNSEQFYMENNNATSQNYNQQAVQAQQFSWYSKLAKKIAYPSRQNPNNSKCFPRWVYGIDITPLTRPFLQLPCSTIVYSSSSLAIVYSIPQNSQRIYSQHRSTITCLAHSRSLQCLASGQLGNNPSIHLWHQTTLQTLKILKTSHLCGISLLSFADKDRKLLTIGSNSHNSVLIYSMDSFELVCSACLPGRVLRGLGGIEKRFEDTPGVEAEINRCVVAWSAAEFYYFQVAAHFTYRMVRLEDKKKVSEITACCGLFINLNRPTARSYSKLGEVAVVVSGHEQGEICLTSESGSFQVLTRVGSGAINQIEVFEEGIVCSSQSTVYFYDFGLLVSEVQPFCKVDLSELKMKLLSNKVRCFGLDESKVLIMTEQAQLISIDSQQTLLKQSPQSPSTFSQQFSCHKINTLFLLHHSTSKTLSIIQKHDFQDRILFLCSNQQRIIGLSLATHEVIDVWSIPDVINVIDTVSCDDGLIFFVLGCRSGRLYIRVDWEESPRCYNCASEITEVRLAFDGSCLLACTRDRHLFVFSNSNNSFVAQAPRKIHFDNQAPCSVSFADDNKSFLVCMDSRNIYQFYLPQLKHKSPLKDSDKIYISQLSAVFCLQVSRQTQLILPGLLGGGQRLLFLTENDGTIRCYQNQQELEANSYTKLFGHTGPVARLLVPAQQDCLLTLGGGTMIQWGIEEIVMEGEVVVGGRSKGVGNQSGVVVERKDTLSSRQKKQSTYDGLIPITNTPPDSFILCRGLLHPSIQSSLNQTLPPQPNNHHLSNISLLPSYLYGFQCLNKRNSLICDSLNLNQLYLFTSRFVFKLNSSTLQQQTIYEKPRMRVSCISLSPETHQLAIGQASKNPCIYLIEPSLRLQTGHKDGIIHMAWFQELLFSFGVSGAIYSINVHNVRTGELVRERYVQERVDRFMILSKEQFVSIQAIYVWRELYPSRVIGEATAGDLMGGQANRDVCLGNKDGGLMILSNSRLFTVKKQAHDKAIIALRTSASDLFSLITAGEDEVIKIWNKDFKELASVHLRSQEIVSCLTEQNAVTIPQQPLHTYSIDVSQDKIFIGISNGQLLKLQLLRTCTNPKPSRLQTVGTSFMISQSLLQQPPTPTSETFQVKHTQLMSGHARSPGPCFSLHPRLPLLVSSCRDSQLTCTNYHTKLTIGWYSFQRINISALKFSPNQKFLAIGFESGELRLYQPIIKPGKDGTPGKFTLSLTQYFETQKSAIVCIEFSCCSTFLAVSYMPSQRNTAEDFEENPRSTVVLFRNRDSNSQRSENHYFKHCEFRENITEVFKTEENSLAVCATCMTFIGDQEAAEKDTAGFYLVLYYQSLTQQRLKLHRDTKAEYRVYDIRKKSFLKDQQLNTVDWSQCQFPNSIHAKQIQPPHQPITIAQMLQCGSNLIYGSTTGDLFITPKQSLSSSKRCSDLKPSELFPSKTFPALTSCISHMQLSHDLQHLFVSSTSDGCLLQFQILQQQTSDLKQLFEIADPETMNRQQFYNYVNNVIPARELISSILEDIEDQPKSELELQLAYVVGRRAVDRRKNLFYDGVGSLVYTLGPNVVLEEVGGSEGEQRRMALIKGDPQEYSCSPQISCFTVDPGCQLLALATEQQKAKIVVWGIHTRLCLASIKVPCTIVQGLSFSKTTNLICLYGITDAYHPILLLLDWHLQSILCQSTLLFHPIPTLKDLLFHKPSQFLTCGIQHLTLWTHTAGSLTSHSFSLDSTPDTTFTVVTCVRNRILTACENGFVYLWARGKAVSRMKVHDGAVRCLGVLPGTSLLVTGGMDGRVGLVEVAETGVVVKNQWWLMGNEVEGQGGLGRDGKLFSVRYDIQALCVDRAGAVYVGTRSGDIYKIRQSEAPLQLLFCDDHDRIVSVCFSEDSTQIYTITGMGHFQIWDLKKTRLAEHHFRCHCLKLLPFKKDIILLQQKSLCVIQPQPPSCTPTLLPQPSFQLTFDSPISFGKLSPNCRLLAIATTRDKHQLHLYDVDSDGFKLVRTHILSSQVQFIDFSIDDRYLLFKDKSQDLGIVETKQLKRINTIFIEYEIQWAADGIVINEKAMNIHSCYHRENTIGRVVQLGARYVLVADQIGTLRLFEYPCSAKRVGELHLRCYSEHMNFVRCLEVSQDGRWVASVSEVDRALIIWRVLGN